MDKIRKIIFENIYAVANRSKPSQEIIFNPPVKGKNDNELIGYKWAFKEGEKYSNIEGGLINARVSDWEKAIASDDTGRDLVHQFIIKTPENEKIVSAESVLSLLGFVDKQSAKYIPSLFSAIKTLASLKLKYQIFLSAKEEWKTTYDKINSKSPYSYEINNVKYRDDGTDSIEFVKITYGGNKELVVHNFDREIKDLTSSINGRPTFNQRISNAIISNEMKLQGFNVDIPRDYKDLAGKIKKQEDKVQKILDAQNQLV